MAIRPICTGILLLPAGIFNLFTLPDFFLKLLIQFFKWVDGLIYFYYFAQFKLLLAQIYCDILELLDPT